MNLDQRGLFKKNIGEENKLKVKNWVENPLNKGKSRAQACTELGIGYSTFNKYFKILEESFFKN